MIRFIFHPLRFFRILVCAYRHYLTCKRQRQYDECQVAKWYEDNY